MKRSISTSISFPKEDQTLVIELSKNMTPGDIITYLRNVMQREVSIDSVVLFISDKNKKRIMTSETKVEDITNGLTASIIIVPAEFNLKIIYMEDKSVFIKVNVLSTTSTLIDEICSKIELRFSSAYELYFSINDPLHHSLRRTLPLIENMQYEKPLYLMRRWWPTDTLQNANRIEIPILFEQAKNFFFRCDSYEKFDYIDMVAIYSVVHFNHDLKKAKDAAKSQDSENYFPSFVKGFLKMRKVFNAFEKYTAQDNFDLMKLFIQNLFDKDPFFFNSRFPVYLGEEKKQKKRYFCYSDEDLLILKSDKVKILYRIQQSHISKWSLAPPTTLFVIYYLGREGNQRKYDQIKMKTDSLPDIIAHIGDYTQFISPILKKRKAEKKKTRYLQKTKESQAYLPEIQKTTTVSIPALMESTLSVFDSPMPQKVINVCIPISPRTIQPDALKKEVKLEMKAETDGKSSLVKDALELITKIDKEEDLMPVKDIALFISMNCPTAVREVNLLCVMPQGSYLPSIVSGGRVLLSAIWKYTEDNGSKVFGLNKFCEIMLKIASKNSRQYKFSEIVACDAKLTPSETVFALVDELVNVENEKAHNILSLFFIALTAAFLSCTLSLPLKDQEEILISQVKDSVPVFDAIAAYKVYKITKNNRDFCSLCLSEVLRCIESPTIISNMFVHNCLDKIEEPTNIFEASTLFEYLRLLSLAIYFAPLGQHISLELADTSLAMLRGAYTDDSCMRNTFFQLQNVMDNVKVYIATKDKFLYILQPFTPLTTFLSCLINKKNDENSTKFYHKMLKLDFEKENEANLNKIYIKNKKALIEKIDKEDKEESNKLMKKFVFIFLAAKKAKKEEEEKNKIVEVLKSEWDTSIFDRIINIVEMFLMWENDKLAKEELIKVLE